MHLTTVRDCDKRLDFSPLAKWPDSLPAMSWRGTLLCGFQRDDSAPVLELDGTTGFLDALLAVHPRLSVSEVARLLKCVEIMNLLELDFGPLLECFGLYPSHENLETLGCLSCLPREFQDWVSERAVSLRELAPLRWCTLDALAPILKCLVHRNPSKSLGTQILETAAEILALQRTLETPTPTQTTEQWLAKLKSVRFPMAADRDRRQEEKMRRLPWPAHAQVRWLRVGDESGVEVKFHATSIADFERHVKALVNVDQTIKRDPDASWE